MSEMQITLNPDQLNELRQVAVTLTEFNIGFRRHMWLTILDRLDNNRIVPDTPLWDRISRLERQVCEHDERMYSYTNLRERMDNLDKAFAQQNKGELNVT